MLSYTVPVAFDQQDALGPLLSALQSVLQQQKSSASLLAPFQGPPTILIIDAHMQQAQTIATYLTAAGYRPLVTATALQAFTSFLQERMHPYAIILGQEGTQDRFFLQRLLQQAFRLYGREIPILRLQVSPATRTSVRVSSLAQLSPLPTTSNITPKEELYETPTLLHVPVSRPLTNLAAIPVAIPQAEPSLRVASLTKTSPPVKICIRAMGDEKKKFEKISLEGQSIGRYQLATTLGSGPGGDVYLAYDRLLEQNVALKVVRTNTMYYHAKDDEPSFQYEVDLIAKLSHPHIFPLLNCGEAYISGYPFIYKVMPLCAEGSLVEWLRKQDAPGMLTVRDTLHIVGQVAEALQFAHDHEITYRNFKMSNILIQSPAKNMQRLHIHLSDFAVAQEKKSPVMILSSLPYIAPEQWNGGSEAASDQYALAALAYELMAGRPPFQASSPQVMKRLHLTMSPQPPDVFNPSLPPAINHVLLQALAKRPEERFASVGGFMEMLQR